MRQMASAIIPLGRPAQPEEAAGPVLFLASPLAELRPRPGAQRHRRAVRRDVHLSSAATEGRSRVRYLDVADRIWPLTPPLHGRSTRSLYKATGGSHRAPACPASAAPILLLDHVGAKSGAKRTSPLLYFRDGDDVVIVASKGGYPKHPAWYHNLMANPDTAVQIGPEHRPVHARVANARGA